MQDHFCCILLVTEDQPWFSVGGELHKGKTIRKQTSTMNIYWKNRCWSWCCNTLATWYEELTHEKRPWCSLEEKLWPDRMLKSRDITLPTKVHLVKAMVFPGVMYGCENWTIKKAEHQRIDVFELWCWRLNTTESGESLGLQGDPTSPS